MKTDLHVSVAMCTKYDLSDKIESLRFQLALKTIELLVNTGYTLYISDASTDSQVEESLKASGANNVIKHDPHQSYGKQKIDLLAHIQNDPTVDAVFLMEPEKHGLVKFIPQLLHALSHTKADIVIPSRVSLNSYPDFQKHGELMGNIAFREITGRDLDVWFGPQLMSRKGVKNYLMHSLQEGDTWQPTFGNAVRAIRRGLKVVSSTIDYRHPSEQTHAEETSVAYLFKRIDQLGIITNYMYALNEKLAKKR